MVAKLDLFGLTTAAGLWIREKNQKRHWWLLETCIEGEWGGIEVTFSPKFYSLWAKKKNSINKRNIKWQKL